MGLEACRRAHGGQGPFTVRSPDIILVMWVWVSRRMRWTGFNKTATDTDTSHSSEKHVCRVQL